MRNDAFTYCANYRRLPKVQAAIKAYNERMGYEKLSPPEDLENCDNCTVYPRMMVIKVCFEQRLRWKIWRWGFIITHPHRYLQFRSPIYRK